MPANPFHLAWFGSFSRSGFAGKWSSSDARSWASGEYHVELARALERAGFDYMMFQDSPMVSDFYGGSMKTNLKHGSHGPKHDPMALVPIIAKHTKNIGLITTASTSFYPPWMLARTLSTLSHLSEGRTGWNIVTSSGERAAQNFGVQNLPRHDERYDRADEYCELVTQLLESWEPDALVLDRDTNTFADGDKVHPINFEGKYFRSRGPLNAMAPYGGRPIFCQAGSSARGAPLRRQERRHRAGVAQRHRRDEEVSLTATLRLAGACWGLALHQMSGMDMGVSTQLGSFGSLLTWWALMIAAMMLPSAAPVVVRRARSSSSGLGGVLLFVSVYLAVWTAVGVVVYLAFRPRGTLTAGVLVIAAGLYELSPLKRRCRQRCRQSISSGQFALGCVGSGLGLMVAFVALGVMNTGWMAMFAVLVFAQKILPAKRAIDIPVALIVVALGVVIILAPASIPGLMPPNLMPSM